MGWGVHASLAGLDASSSRSPSVLVLLVLADLDGSYPWRYSHSSKILFDDLSENIIYYRGISPGKPALLPTGTSVSSPGRFDWSDGGVLLPANLGTIVREPEEVDCLPSPLGILVQGLGGSPSPPLAFSQGASKFLP